jgi:hypothetical protein
LAGDGQTDQRPLGFLGLGSDEEELENQIELEEVVGLIEADESPNSPVAKRTGSSRRRAASGDATPSPGARGRRVRETRERRRVLGVGGQAGLVHST